MNHSSGLLYWLLSLVLHAGLLAWVATLGVQPGRLPEPDNQPEAAAVTPLILVSDAAPEPPPPQVEDEPLVLLVPGASSVSLATAWPEFRDENPAQSAVPKLEDLAGSPPGDGRAAQGVGLDASAGSLDLLDALETTATSAEEWDRISLRTIGFGRPGGNHGTGNQAAGSGFGGGGQGAGGIAGAGYGEGTSGAGGSGPGGTGAAKGTGKAGGGVEPLFMGSGDYPERARRNRQEGVVHLKVEVLADGKTGTVEVLKSSGTQDLDEAAVKAARKWRFKPAQRDGHAIPVWVEVPVRYQLQDGG